MAKICYRWGFANVLWKNANWTWSECQIIEDLLTLQPDGVDATTLIQPWLIEPWNPYRTGEKKKKLVRLICKIKGVEYDESKTTKDFNVTVDDIKLVIDKGREIGLDIKQTYV
jgi:hypothetical protein